jgi:DNA repair protein RecO (recombination protein O)
MARTGYVTEALVLRTIPFGETSQVVHLATPEHGLVAALAKGAHRPGSEVEGGLTLLALGEARLTPSRRADGDGLELLQRFRQRDAFRGLGKDLDRYHAAAYVLELLRAWMKPALPSPSLYAAGVTALRALATCDRAALPAWIAWFEARATAAAGHRPALDACAACGGALTGTLVFSAAAGGASHRSCAPPGPRAALGPATLAALQALYTRRLPEFVAEPLSASQLRALRRVHDVWLPWLLERRPAARDGLPQA